MSAAADVGSSLPGYQAVVESAGLFDRDERGLLRVAGKDVTRFLNGVVSSEALALEVGSGQPALFLSAKGKLLGRFDLYRVASEVCLLRFREPLREDFSKALARYALLSSIELHDARAERGMLSVEGPRAAEVLCPWLGEELRALPSYRRWETGAAIGSERASVVVTRGGESPEGGFDLEVPRPQLAQVGEELRRRVAAAGGGVVERAAAEILRIEAGVGRFGVDFDSRHFPAEAGLESALSFSKCYVGQEVVARMRTYGQFHRRLSGLRLEGPSDAPLPAAGARLLDAAGGEAGHMTSPTISPRCGRIALARVGQRHWDPGQRLAVEGSAGEAAVVVSLPFVSHPSV